MTFKIKTKKQRQLIDITEFVTKQISKVNNESGLVNIFVMHTTCAITTIDSDPGIEPDFFDFIDELTPDVDFRHPHNPEHTPDHLYSSIIGPYLNVPFKDKKLRLGTWQRIVLVEFNGPKEREIQLSFIEII